MAQLAGGKPVGFLQAWPGIWTSGYCKTIPGIDQSRTLTQYTIQKPLFHLEFK